MENAIIVLGHGSRNPANIDEFEEIIQMLREKHPSQEIFYAFAEFSEPSLEDAVAALAKENEDLARVIIVPLFLSLGNHLTKALPKRMENLWRSYPKISFSVTEHIGADPLLCDIISKRIDSVM